MKIQKRKVHSSPKGWLLYYYDINIKKWKNFYDKLDVRIQTNH